nr:PREDICTED: uncharacterized protein LOC109040863 [Bemisia tabaci]
MSLDTATSRFKMVSFSLLQVFALIIAACAGADDFDSSQQPSISATSSINLAKSGAPQGSWQAGAYNGNYYAPPRPPNYPHMPYNSLNNLYTYTSYLQQYIAQLQAIIQRQIEAQRQSVANYVSSSVAPLTGGVQGAMAGGFVGPNGGGHGEASLLPYPTNAQGGPIPAGPGLQHPGAPNYHAVFSSASSSSSDVNGEHKQEHSATFGVNNNGQVTTYTAHSP